MTPQETFDYKTKWKPTATLVQFHSDFDYKAKNWCRKHLQRHQWSMTTYTDVYEHTMLFEHPHHAQEFKQEFCNETD